MLISKPDPLLWPSTWARINRAEKIDLTENTRFILKPAYEAQGEEFYQAFETVWDSGGWTVYIDELFMMHKVHLEGAVEKLLTQGRSNAITVVSGVQRPSWVTRFAFSEARHVMAGKMADKADLKRVSEIIGEQYADATKALAFHDFMWLDRNTDTMQVVTRDTVREVFGGLK